MSLPLHESRDLCRQFELLHEGTLPFDAWKQLDDRFRIDPEARLVYIRYLQLCAGLAWDFGGLGQTDRAAVLNDIHKPPSANSVVSLTQSRSSLANPFHSSGRPSLLAAVLLVAVVFYGGFAVVAWNLRPERWVQGPVQDVSRLQTTGIAVLTAAENCQWVTSSARLSPTVGSRWTANEWLHLVSGVAQLTFADGAVVRLEGPTRFRVQSVGQGFLELGRLVAHVPRQAVGFTVVTPTATILDLGTEFGVEVSEDQVAEIEVLAGKVQVSPATPSATSAKTQLLAGQAVRVGLGSSTVSIPANPNKFQRQRFLLADHQKDGETRRQERERLQHDPDLAARYVCGEQNEHSTRLLNLDSRGDGPIGTLMQGTKPGDGKWNGPRWTATPDRRGSSKTSMALSFNGNQDHVAFEAFDFGRQFTFAAWIYPTNTQKLAILVHNMDFADEKNGFYLALSPTRDPNLPSARAELQFAVHDGDDRRYFARSAPDCFQYGKWQHVALTVNANDLTARMYRDGIAVADGRANPGELKIDTQGEWNLGCGDAGNVAFMGLADEVMIFHRILSIDEIADLAQRHP